MAGALQRYQKLGLRETLTVSYRYPLACRELSVILRVAYSQSPKPLQSLLLQDTIAAFRLLPQMQTQNAVSAAKLLSESAMAALPKQKRVLAATEFKQAKVAYKRRAKIQLEGKELVQLPQDVLVHLFSLLDMQSLVSAGMVCRSWNVAANENSLWQLHHNTHFGDSESILKIEGLQCGNAAEDVNYDWKDAFRRAYSGLSSWRNNRGYCGHCNSIVWLRNLKCPNEHSKQGSGDQQLRPIAPSEIVLYILEDKWLSDGDSESDEDFIPMFWSYPLGHY